MARVEFSEWIVESLRVTIFPTVESTFRSSDWWEYVTGVEPDQVSTSAKKTASTVEGTYEGRKLIMRSVPDRIDWFLLPVDSVIEEAMINSEVPSVGRAGEAFELFSTAVEKWFASADLPTMHRIAFGAVLSLPIGDRRSAYIELRDYIPVEIDPDSTDILYQINIPTKSASVAGLKLNRLSRWLVTQHTFVTVPVGVAGGTPITQGPTPAAMKLELDINTLPAFEQTIPKESLAGLYRELVDAGRDIASNGVIKK